MKIIVILFGGNVNIPYICTIKLIKTITVMALTSFKNKNVRFFDQPERIFKMDYIHIYKGGVVDMMGTTPEGVEVDNVRSQVGEFQAWDYDEQDPSIK